MSEISFAQPTSAAAASTQPNTPALPLTDRFVNRHLGPKPDDVASMLKELGFETLDAFIDQVVPAQIRHNRKLNLPPALSEFSALEELRSIASKNQIFRSFIGTGYSDCITPPVIQRNILENPGWYTPYTPYQAEVSQGRLESLINFQTMIRDLTGMQIANASLLDEGTAAAESMAMCFSIKESQGRDQFFISENCHPQTIDVVKTRALPLKIKVEVGNHRDWVFSDKVFGVLVQYPDTNGEIHCYEKLIEQAHAAGAMVTVAADLLSLTLLKPPGDFGADVAVGSAQRFGVPLGFGGPHAAYFATRDDFKREMPGRLVGVSKDAQGNPGYRLSLQTREQHIRREKATSNICTAQALLANIAAMYAVYHGPAGLKQIALRVHHLTEITARGLTRLGFSIGEELFFDTLKVRLGKKRAEDILRLAEAEKVNLRIFDNQTVGVSLDETVQEKDLIKLFKIFNGGATSSFQISEISGPGTDYPEAFARKSGYLSHPVFNSYHSETEILRYLKKLENRDLTLTNSMIPLGSCTMKLNATAEMFPVTWAEFSKIHPFAPLPQSKGYQIIFRQLEQWLADITGFSGISLQPNAGSAGELAGLLVIRRYHETRGQGDRNICLIPTSAHGTNPASAVMAGFKVVAVACDSSGNIDLNDLKAKAETHASNLAVLMATYPSTHGVFEEAIKEVCQVIHQHGGQVYMDGANMNAQVGLCSPGELGADVCHLNLHKTFCIPHGGGGPGMGPIGVAEHLVEFLPGHPVVNLGGEDPIGAISAAPWGSASILLISWMYIVMMGPDGLTEATKIAILNANYMARKLDPYFPVLYKGKTGLVAHECIVDLRKYKAIGIEVEDTAKRLMDYGFHAPTVSFPVPGTMMIEPTESESKSEIDRFCDAMISIHNEIQEVASGKADKVKNVLKNAPHTAQVVVADQWDRPYTRQQAAFPKPWLVQQKYWPPVGRIDNVFGDRNLICSCIGMEAYSS